MASRSTVAMLVARSFRLQRAPGAPFSTASPDGLGQQPKPRKRRWLVGVLLFLNLAVGGYILFGTDPQYKISENTTADDDQSITTNKDKSSKEDSEEEEEVSTKEIDSKKDSTKAVVTAAVSVIPSSTHSQAKAAAVKHIVSAEEQRELLKWMLEEKRKIKPKNRAEKAQIDSEKALLKSAIRGKAPLLN